MGRLPASVSFAQAKPQLMCGCHAIRFFYEEAGNAMTAALALGHQRMQVRCAAGNPALELSIQDACTAQYLQC